MSTSIDDQFRQAFTAAGFEAPQVFYDDSAIHRCSSGGHSSDKPIWYVLHSDGIPAGAFGDWRTGLSFSWCAKAENAMTPAERDAHRQRVKAMRAQREADGIERHEEAALEAERIWKASEPCDENAYLLAKGVMAYGVRQGGQTLRIPMRDTSGKLWNIERVNPADFKDKRGLLGGKRKGCFHTIGTPNGKIIVCEGYATGASIHEATGDAVAVAFNAGNVLPVASALHKKHPGLAIILAADDDHHTEGNPGMSKAKEAAVAVGGTLAVPDFGADRPDRATDFNDLHQAAGLEAVQRCIQSALPVTPEVLNDAENDSAANDLDEDAEGEKKSTLASQLVTFVRERVELFHDENRDTFAFLTDAQETFRLTGANFKNWLMAEFYKVTRKAARDQSVREALSVLTGLALFDGEQKPVHVRVAKSGDAYFLDLGQSGNSLAAKIEAGRWALVEQHEVRFIRPESMRALPTPDAAGDINKLWELINVPTGSRLLVLAWLVECLRADTVFPVLEFLGEAGSAKSSAQKALRRLIDPNASNLRSPPKSVEDMFVSAGVNWFASFENISHLTPPMQDGLCVLATGGGFAKRKLYSDGDEAVINVMRPVVLNGISACVTAHDLIDRSICVELPVLTVRHEDAAIEREFEAAYAGLVGGLLNLMAQTLKELPGAQLAAEDRPRMAGFARLGVAVERAMGAPPGEFLRQFHASRRESIERTIDASPVASALVDWFEAQRKPRVELSVKALLEEVEKFKPAMADAWPKSPKGFGDALRRAAPSLRYMGLEVKSLGKVGSSVKWSVKAVKAGGPAPTPSPDQTDHLLANPLEVVEVVF